jgi:hypothetical protein
MHGQTLLVRCNEISLTIFDVILYLEINKMAAPEADENGKYM